MYSNSLARFGGGIYNAQTISSNPGAGLMTIVNSNITENTASGGNEGTGGGIYNIGGLSLINC